MFNNQSNDIVTLPADASRQHLPLHDLESANNLFVARPSGLVVVGPAVIQLAKMIPVFFVYRFLREYWEHAWQLLVVAGAVLAWFPLRNALALQCIRYEIEGDRIHFKEGIVNSSTASIEIYRIRNISLHQNAIERLLDIGTIVIEANDVYSQLRMYGMRHPEQMRRGLIQYVQGNRQMHHVPEFG